jgi:ABC-type Na+ efflux pump permease subunit
MRLQNAWSVAWKDLNIITQKKSTMLSIILFPVLISILFPLVIYFGSASSGSSVPIDYLPQLLNSFSIWFIIESATLPTTIASYSIVGEKVEKSLEPLLATPLTDSEILLGKSLSAFLPPLISIYSSSLIFMGLLDSEFYGQLGYLYFPNWDIAVILLVAVPIASILSVEVSVLVSARTSDVRTAQNFSGVMFMPFLIIYLGGEIGIITLNTVTLLLISAVLLLISVILFYISRSTFQREEILTKWK